MMKKSDITPEDMAYYRKMGEYYDTHDALEPINEADMAEIEVQVRHSVMLYEVDSVLSDKISALARLRGETAEKLMEAWLWDRLRKESEAQGVDLESLDIPQPVIS